MITTRNTDSAINKFNKVQELIFSRMPHKPYVSMEKSDLSIKSKKHSIHYNYIQLNPICYKQALVFDIDIPNPWIWSDRGLPPPNAVIYDESKGTPHLIYLLDNFVMKDNYKQYHKFKLLEQAYKDRLGADLGYAGLITKNPLESPLNCLSGDSAFWVKEFPRIQAYDFQELEEWVELTGLELRTGRELVSFEASGGRNDYVFNYARKLCYLIFNYCKTHKEFQEQARLAVEHINQLMVQKYKVDSLPDVEIRAISKSIARWVIANSAQLSTKAPRAISKMIEQGKPIFRAVIEYKALSMQEQKVMAGEIGFEASRESYQEKLTEQATEIEKKLMYLIRHRRIQRVSATDSNREGVGEMG